MSAAVDTGLQSQQRVMSVRTWHAQDPTGLRRPASSGRRAARRLWRPTASAVEVFEGWGAAEAMRDSMHPPWRCRVQRIALAHARDGHHGRQRRLAG